MMIILRRNRVLILRVRIFRVRIFGETESITIGITREKVEKTVGKKYSIFYLHLDRINSNSMMIMNRILINTYYTLHKMIMSLMISGREGEMKGQ
jgi:hypothetical protein